MYRKCATELSAQHQKQVTESLLELMRKMPYEEITVTQLCQAAGVTRRVFYHLFSNKTGALHALIDNKILDLESYGRNIPNESLRFFCYWKEQKTLLDVLEKNRMFDLLQERMIKCVLEEDYDVWYLLRRKGWSENGKEVIVFFLCGLIGLVYSWYHSGYLREPEEMTALMEQMIYPLFK